MVIENIKDKFNDWLIGAGGKGKASGGKLRTVLGYMSELDKVCDCYFFSHDDSDWNNLATIIDNVLKRYVLCDTRTFYIDTAMSIEFINFLNEIKSISDADKNNKLIINHIYPKINLSFVVDKSFKYITEDNENWIDYIADNYVNSFSYIGGDIKNIFILKQTCDLKSRQRIINALLKFDEFVKGFDDSGNAKPVTSEDKKKPYRNPNYEALKSSISAYSDDYKLWSDLYKRSIPDLLKTIDELQDNQNASLDLTIDNVMEILGCSRKTLKAMTDAKVINFTDEYRYSTPDIVEFLRQSFIKANGKRDFDDYALKDFIKFLKLSAASKKIKMNSRTFLRMSETIARLHFNTKITRFCHYDLRRVKKERKK